MDLGGQRRLRPRFGTASYMLIATVLIARRTTFAAGESSQSRRVMMPNASIVQDSWIGSMATIPYEA
jgi:hypothetical protein